MCGDGWGGGSGKRDPSRLSCSKVTCNSYAREAEQEVNSEGLEKPTKRMGGRDHQNDREGLSGAGCQ